MDIHRQKFNLNLYRTSSIEVKINNQFCIKCRRCLSAHEKLMVSDGFELLELAHYKLYGSLKKL